MVSDKGFSENRAEKKPVPKGAERITGIGVKRGSWGTLAVPEKLKVKEERGSL